MVLTSDTIAMKFIMSAYTGQHLFESPLYQRTRNFPSPSHTELGSCLVDIIIDWQIIKWHNHHHTHHNRFTALFPRPPGWASARRELLDFMVQRKIIEADTPTIRLGATPSGLTSAHLHHPSIFYGPDALPATQLTVSRHWRQLAHSD